MIKNNTYYLIFILFLIILFGCKNDTTSSKVKNNSKYTEAISSKARKVSTQIADSKTENKEEILKTNKVEEIVIKKVEDTKAVAKKEMKKIKKKKVINKKNNTLAIAQIEFLKMNQSFDTLVQGEIFDYNFKFVNTGDTELIIHKATATCGCTQPSFPFIGIQPKDTGYIGVRYISVGKEGHQSPTITVYTNAEPAIYNLHLEGQVILPPDNKSDSTEIEK